MNPSKGFRVTPLKRYKEPSYASESGECTVAHACWLSWLFPQGLVKKAATLLLAAGLAFGVAACNDEDINFNDDQQQQDDDDDTTNTSCEEEGAFACGDEDTVKLCNEDGRWQDMECTEYCEDLFGVDYIPFDSCNEENPENLCQCEYGATDGVMQECDPGYFYCSDEQTLALCTEDYYYDYVNCETYCNEEFGMDYVSYGCVENNPDNPCQCEYDAIDGGITECMPGDMICNDTGTLGVCADEGYYDYQSCETLCSEQYGTDYVSYGCDVDNSGNPCQCEYGMVDGEMVECEPGELSCNDEGNLMTCDNYYWEATDCQEFCRDNFGADYYSTGCDTESELNACQCQYSMIDGEMFECTPGDAMFCTDDGLSLATCSEDGTSYNYLYCNEYCWETIGEFYISAGCDMSNTDDPCQCTYGVTDGLTGDVSEDDMDE